MRAAMLMALAGAAAANDGAVRWWSHISFLASDELQGRDTGSAGHRRAAEYVASRFREVGLEACGDGGYLQTIALESRRVVGRESAFVVISPEGAEVPLTLGRDATLEARSAPGEHEAPMAFAGYGLSIPSHNYDDLGDVDLKGKVAVYINGSPSHLPGPIRAHFSSTAERSRALSAAGAVGSIAIPNPATADVPWGRSVLSWDRPAMALAGRGGVRPQLVIAGSLNPASAGLLLDGGGQRAADLFALATAGKPLPRFALNHRLRARVVMEKTKPVSENVCGVLPGSDVALRGEHVVLTAHLDHLGVAGAIGGDAIYNGAMDNASGIATLIEAARALAAPGASRGRRSVMFVAVTAEERGQLGSRHFVARAAERGLKMAANINMDMFLPIHPMRLWMVLGLEESTLRRPLERVARRLKLEVQADPEPHRNRFIRSDQYSFILRGVPSLALKIGYREGSPEARIQREWTRTRYHSPSDDLTQPVDREAAMRFTEAVAELAREVADESEPPRWNEGSFFRRFARRR